MKLARSVAIGIMLYFTLTIIVILGARTFRSQVTETFWTGSLFWSAGVFATVLLLIFFTSFYFRDMSITVNWKEGLQFGAILLFISAILDATVIFTLYIIHNGTTNILLYYFSPFLWMSALAILVTPPVVAHTMLGVGQ